MSERFPTGITLHQKSRVMEIAFSDGRTFRLPYEYLRVYSPSAEMRGHGPGQENQEKLWSQYLEKLAAAGASRE